ncbi:hypothetical protein HPB50_022249 [Hyalomma asiaticum]|uniref:Uncharacterized protein n=1 Tax=Hyalomma asiaticum TaxID=266040 RepID=A0ACB7S915_HYAAI|nr:hypothetical protein HPB50_022249 [Hyalomma asiaticum]
MQRATISDAKEARVELQFSEHGKERIVLSPPFSPAYRVDICEEWIPLRECQVLSLSCAKITQNARRSSLARLPSHRPAACCTTSPCRSLFFSCGEPRDSACGDVTPVAVGGPFVGSHVGQLRAVSSRALAASFLLSCTFSSPVMVLREAGVQAALRGALATRWLVGAALASLGCACVPLSWRRTTRS